MTVVVWMRFMFCWMCDSIVCLDVYGVFVVVEYCLFLESGCCHKRDCCVSECVGCCDFCLICDACSC